MSDTPYRALATELVADAIALFEQVRGLRPETEQIRGPFHLTVDALAGTIIVGVRLAGEQVVLIERILVDPREPDTFGRSDLPLVASRGEVH